MKLSRNWTVARILCAPDGDGGGEGGDGDRESGSRREQGFQRRLEKHNNDATAFAFELWDDNHNYRRKNAEKDAKIAELEGKLPKDGQVILTAEQAQQWAAYQALGTPEVVKGAVEERGQLQGKLDSLAREKVIRDAATHAGFDFDVLSERDTYETNIGGKKLSYEVREVESNGTKVKTAFIKDGEVEKPLTEYAQEHWAKHLPSLVVKQESGSSQSQGTFYPSQHQGSGGNRPTTAKQQTEATLINKYVAPAQKEK